MLYGFRPKPISYNKPFQIIDALINYVDAHYISWDLGDPKFIVAFAKHYRDWSERDEAMDEILLNDLGIAEKLKSQPIDLLVKLVELTLDTKELQIDFPE